MSLFYHEPAAAQWRQVWVTGRAFAPGGVLTPIARDTVRQVIEVSDNGGAAWRPVFDAGYRRVR